jgi:hypothetical protein
MTNALDNVALLRSGLSLFNDQFSPAPLPPLLELRKTMGLTFEEAVGILFISADSLQVKEASFEEIPHPYCVSSVRHRYLYFLSQFGKRRERNIIQNHLTLLQVRRDILYLDWRTMGSMYGGYTARQWYNFEIHEAILPRDILKTLEQDVHNMQTQNFDQA